MKFTVQTESLTLLREALVSQCDGIRFGSEFCDLKIPRLEVIKEAYEEVSEARKSFTYVTPILSNEVVNKMREQLAYLSDLGDVEVIIGDLGTFNILRDYKNLRPRLGRSRIYIPARCPWPQITRMPNPPFFTRRRVEKIFYQTSLNYRRTLEYYKTLGVEGADVDWIPKCFPHFEQIVKNGFRLAIHIYTIPIAVTMRCHMARFLGEVKTSCSQPCLSRSFNLNQRELEISLVLHGNVVFRLTQHNQREVKALRRIGVDELIIPMGPVSKLSTTKDINAVITTLSYGG